MSARHGTVDHESLDAVDRGALTLAWRMADGASVALRSLGDGEMGGCLMGSPGCSAQRFFEPLPDVQRKLDDEPSGAG